MKRVLLVATLILSACTGTVAPTETPEQTSLVIKGSDTEVQLVSNLAEAFSALNPDADLSVTGGGSTTGIAGLINGGVDLANSSRQMSDEEKQQAAERDLDLQEFIVARDGLSVIVHPDNPIHQLTVEQIGKIYSGEITNWQEVGGIDSAIVLYGRQSTSGTYGYFRDAVVKDDYAPTMRNMEGSQAIVDAVAADKSGVGYVGVGYAKSESGESRTDLGIVNVASAEGGTYVSPLDREAVMRGDYPISRRIYQYLPGIPAKNSLVEQFLRFQASPEGQEIVEETGFYALTLEDAALNDAFFAKIR